MNLRALFIAAANLTLIQAVSIPHDEVKPFPQPIPVTTAQKVAVKYKPQIKISYGSHPFPAVDEEGSISGGLKWSILKPSGECEEAPLGSQIYSRSDSYKDLWATVLTWYFPKGVDGGGIGGGHRHNWEWVIVWLDDPDVEEPTIKAVSMSAYTGNNNSQVPPSSENLNDTSFMAEYYLNPALGNGALKETDEAGETQDLIQWDQLTDEAREVLSDTDWDHSPFHLFKVKFPLKDENFEKRLKSAYPL